MVALPCYLGISTLLFVIGLFGALTKRNAIVVLMCIELMLNAVNINLVTFSRFIDPQALLGQLFVIFTIAVAAAEVAVGLAIIIVLNRYRDTVNLDDFTWLKG
ncbi:MAG: NADH-quinone oxidoreductase subunit NuoK [Ammonifex sp.]|jgi:NADH-quinone oxidoreductase subunit K|nr:MAG: NADH-quinone oxidoreductase subunit NuoK [Ammonifex sp.]